MTDPVEDLRQVVLELADGLQEVAKTLTLGGEVRDTAEAMIALGPLFERFDEAIRLPMGQGGLAPFPAGSTTPKRL